MAGNDNFKQKSITQNRKKTFISKEKNVFCFEHGPWGPHFGTTWATKLEVY